MLPTPVSKEEPQTGDIPEPRFGHSSTFLGNGIVILFGGAIGDSGHYQITDDAYQLDLNEVKWSKLEAEHAPSARAAHGACRVDNLQLVIYGGAAGGGSLSSEDLYLLDVRKLSTLGWMTVPITGASPGRRYGHTLVYYRPNLILFGGNDGQQSLNDIWYMDVEHCPFQWVQVTIPVGAKKPPERVYHSADICRDGPASGMMVGTYFCSDGYQVIFGGRSSENMSLRDVWGLRQHRNGVWDWVAAPVKKGELPDARFQHRTRLFVIGGRELDVTRSLATAVYDTEACEWKSLAGTGRFRHSCWVTASGIYTYAGFTHKTQSHPVSDMQRIDPLNVLDAVSRKRLQNTMRSNGPCDAPPLQKPSQVQSVNRTRPGSTPLADSLDNRSTSTPARDSGDRWVRLANHVHTKIDMPHSSDFASLVRKISLDRLGEEGKKIRGHQTPVHPSYALPAAANLQDGMANQFIARLLRPNITPQTLDAEFNPQSPFCINKEDVLRLVNRCTAIFKQETTVLQLRAPIKVYGDIHGQYYDLMRLFGTYKSPVEEDWPDDNDLPSDVGRIDGDIDSNDYLFLGDFVDRGNFSLEVMCLLLSLKLKYPRQVHLIRGNHEDIAINCTYGFKEECRRRLNEDPDYHESCYRKFNTLFEYLPLGALIEEKILCIHGGIGGTIKTIQDIAEIKRPLKVSAIPSTPTDLKVTDLLWSDPTENDSVLGVVPNDMRDPERSGHIVKFGPDRVLEFINTNHISLIIRAHECVLDGFERFAGGRLITLFSATDYCNHHKNAGALLFIKRDLTVLPKIIYPPSRDNMLLRSTWLTLESRPPTPPRIPRKIRDDFEPFI